MPACMNQNHESIMMYVRYHFLRPYASIKEEDAHITATAKCKMHMPYIIFNIMSKEVLFLSRSSYPERRSPLVKNDE